MKAVCTVPHSFALIFLRLLGLLQNEVMTAYQFKAFRIINTLVWFLHPYSLTWLRRAATANITLRRTVQQRHNVHLHIVYIDGKKWWLWSGKKHAEECTKVRSSASLLLFIPFDVLFLLTLFAHLMKTQVLCCGWWACMLTRLIAHVRTHFIDQVYNTNRQKIYSFFFLGPKCLHLFVPN